jgi:hypothetical protein
VICSITSSGLEMPPDQKAFQIESIWLRSSPVSMVESLCVIVAPPFLQGGVDNWPILYNSQPALRILPELGVSIAIVAIIAGENRNKPFECCTLKQI